MSDASEWLIEITAHDGTDELVLRYSSGGYVSRPTDTPANTTYDARLSALGNFGRHLFGAGRTIGSIAIENGDIVIDNIDRTLDGLADLGVDGRAVVVRRLTSPRAALSTAQTVLRATAESLDTTSAMVSHRLRFYDRRRDLDRPIQETKYGGTTTSGASKNADGTPDMAGQVKPLCYGPNRNVRGVMVDPYNLVIQVHDGEVQSITAYDGGVALTNAGDVANLAALYAATGNPGQYVTCNALGLWRPFGSFNGRPAFVWTADVVEGASGQRNAARIIERMLTKLGLGADIDSASFDALATAAPAETGLHIENETSGLAAIRKILDGCHGWIIPTVAGDFKVGKLVLPGTPVMDIIEPEILTASADETVQFIPNPDTDGNIPAWRITVKWGRNWHTHSDSDMGGCVTFEFPTRATELQREWREAVAENPALLTKHKLAPEIVIETGLSSQAAAQAFADELLSFYGTRREVSRVAIAWDESGPADFNATVALEIDRDGYRTGKPMVVIGREEAWASEQAILTIWG